MRCVLEHTRPQNAVPPPLRACWPVVVAAVAAAGGATEVVVEVAFIGMDPVAAPSVTLPGSLNAIL